MTASQLVETVLGYAQHIPPEVAGSIVGLIALAVARRHLGGWPDLWRARRIALPLLAQFEDHPYVPEETQLGLLDEEFVGVVDAPPAELREFFNTQANWWPANIASIQLEHHDDGTEVYEVGSYARRVDGFTGMWQTHVRLTPRDGGQRTAVWAHYERSPFGAPKKHLNSVGWQSGPGVATTAAILQDSTFSIELSNRAQLLLEAPAPAVEM